MPVTKVTTKTAVKKPTKSKKTTVENVVPTATLLRPIENQAFDEIEIDMLKDVLERSDTMGCLYLFPSDGEMFFNAGFVEINREMMDEAGRIAVRINEAGREYLKSLQQVQEPASIEVPKVSTQEKGTQMFKIEKDVPMPTIKRRKKASAFPFDEMEVGDSFFVGNTEDNPDLVKQAKWGAASATNRFAVPDPDGLTRTNRKGEVVPKMIQTRRFVVRSEGEGVRVWREM